MYVKVSARDLIGSPFTKCPKCGEDSFGVLSIHAHHYSKRCKSCLYPPGRQKAYSVPLPPLDKKVIYVDQFVISKIMFALNETNPIHRRMPDADRDRWLKVFDRLDVLAKKQLLICPSSEFHRNESIASGFFSDLERMYEHLSDGIEFGDTDTIRLWHILEAFRNWVNGSEPKKSEYVPDTFLHGDRTAWTERFRVQIPMRRDSSFVEELRVARDQTHKGIEKIFQRWQSEKQKVFDDWYSEEVEGSVRFYWKGFLDDLKQREMIIGRVRESNSMSFEDAGGLLPGHESKVVLQLVNELKDRGFDPDTALQELVAFFESPQFASVPFVRIGAAIWATVAHKAAHEGLKRAPDQGFWNDVSLIRALYPYCDAMFLDKECHKILSHKHMAGIAQEFGTRIFSLRNLDEFFSFLDGIEQTASEEHIESLREVYGESAFLPYRELFA